MRCAFKRKDTCVTQLFPRLSEGIGNLSGDLDQLVSSIVESNDGLHGPALVLLVSFEIVAVGHVLVTDQTRCPRRTGYGGNQRIRETVIAPRNHSEA